MQRAAHRHLNRQRAAMGRGAYLAWTNRRRLWWNGRQGARALSGDGIDRSAVAFFSMAGRHAILLSTITRACSAVCAPALALHMPAALNTPAIRSVALPAPACPFCLAASRGSLLPRVAPGMPSLPLRRARCRTLPRAYPAYKASAKRPPAPLLAVLTRWWC